MFRVARSAPKTDPWELLHRYQQRYGVTEDLTPALHLERTIARRRAKADALGRRADELETLLAETLQQLKAVRHEIEGSRKTAELFAEEVLDSIRREHDEGWSPIPVFGYRIWVIRNNGLYGAMTRWWAPELTSICLNQVKGDDIPHSIRRCGPPACGIYATKELDVLRKELGVGDIDGYVVGVVALEGKVVEHTRGYRAARARAAAVTSRHMGRHLQTDDRDVIDSLFADPAMTVAETGVAGRPEGGSGDRYLNQWKEENDKWTWEKRSES